MMLAHVYLKKGCIVPKHNHENEQLTYILEGALRFSIGDDGKEIVDVRAGEVLHPSHVWHRGRGARGRAGRGRIQPAAPGLDQQNRRVSARKSVASNRERLTSREPARATCSSAAGVVR